MFLTEKMKYATFLELNRKDHETYIYYLQYDGNEEELLALKDIIRDADFSGMSGDYSEFDIDIDNLLSKSSVDEQIKIKFDGYCPFDVCNGKFDFHQEDFYGLGDMESALKLDDMFYGCRIENYFH